MNCCSAINADTSRLFSRLAWLHRLHFRVFGFERTQRQLIRAICDAGIEGATLLDVGCGPGDLHRALLRSGAARATGVDLSEGMLEIARAGAQAEGLGALTEYRQGDFTQIAPDLPEADLVVLDKVICCYPHWEGLVDGSLTKARRLYAITIPRSRTLTWAALGLMRWALRGIGCRYQPFIHDPARIEARILAHGFLKRSSALARWPRG